MRHRSRRVLTYVHTYVCPLLLSFLCNCLLLLQRQMIYKDGSFGPTFVSVDVFYSGGSAVSCHMKQPPPPTHAMRTPLHIAWIICMHAHSCILTSAHRLMETCTRTCTHIYEFTHTATRCTHTGAHIQVHTYRCTHTGAHIQVHTYRCTHTGAHIQVHTYRCTHTGAHIQVHTYRCAHTGAHIQVHTYRCTHTGVHMHTNMSACVHKLTVYVVHTYLHMHGSTYTCTCACWQPYMCTQGMKAAESGFKQ